jgi:hypothetical protein
MEYWHKDILSYYIMDHLVDISALEGLSGIIPHDPTRIASKWILTSPNIRRRMYEPSLGIRDVKPMENGLCGLDDRAQYPQFLTKGFEYACCIPRPAPGLEDLFWRVKVDDTELIIGMVILTNTRMLKDECAQRLKSQLTITAKIAFECLEHNPQATLLSSFIFYAQ